MVAAILRFLEKGPMSARPPVLMLHGAFCGGWAFDTFRVPFEAAGFAVHAPTLRHHEPAASLKRLASTSLTDYTGDLLRVIDELDEPPVLVGHSLGGLLAQMIAAQRAVRAAVLIAPCAPWGVMPTTFFEMASAQTLLLAGGYWNTVLKPDYGVAAANSLDRLPHAERKAVFDLFVPESGLATFEILSWGLDVRRASHVLARKVTCPLLCLSGSEDKINPASTVRRIAERYEGRAVFEELDGYSHWPIGEPGWEMVAGRALLWLAGILDDESQKEEA
jgi:pimeloyl-ACP methyl ester carboxylesterase